MAVYLGGQIKKECRGELAVVVCNGSGPEYDAFLYPIQSEEFVNLTGVRAASNPIVRVYSGVNQSSGQDLVRRVSSVHSDPTILRELDDLVVIPFFQTKPEISQRI